MSGIVDRMSGIAAEQGWGEMMLIGIIGGISRGFELETSAEGVSDDVQGLATTSATFFGEKLEGMSVTAGGTA